MNKVPRDRDTLLESATRAVQSGDWEQAIEDCNKVLAADPSHQRACFLVAYARRHRGLEDDLAVADSVLEAGLKAAPDSLELLTERGYVASAGRRWDEAEGWFRLALSLKQPPDRTARTFLGLADVYLDTRRDDDAEELLEEAKQSHPEDPHVALRLGIAHLNNGHVDMALRQFERAQGEAETVGSARHWIGAAYLAGRRYAEAQKVFRQAIVDSPEDLQAISNLAWTLALEGKDRTLTEAEEQCRRVLNRDGHHVQALECLGIVFFQRGNLRLAESYLRRAAAADPTEPRLLTRLGFLYHYLDDTDAARCCFDQAIGVDSDFDLSYLGRGSVSYALGEYRSALRDFRRAETLRPASVHAAVGVGLGLARLGRLDEAESYLMRSLKRVDRYDAWRVRLALAQILSESGDAIEDLEVHEEALVHAGRALEQRHASKEVLLMAGIAAAKAGRLRRAKRHFSKAVKLDSSDLRTQRLLRKTTDLVHVQLSATAVSWTAQRLLLAMMLSQLVAVWYLFTTSRLNTTQFAILLPVMLGAVFVVFFLKRLTHLKLLGFEARMELPVEINPADALLRFTPGELQPLFNTFLGLPERG